MENIVLFHARMGSTVMDVVFSAIASMVKRAILLAVFVTVIQVTMVKPVN